MKDIIPEFKNLLDRERKTEQEKEELYRDLFHVPRFGHRKNRDNAYYYSKIESLCVSLWRVTHIKSCSSRLSSSYYSEGKLSGMCF